MKQIDEIVSNVFIISIYLEYQFLIKFLFIEIIFDLHSIYNI